MTESEFKKFEKETYDILEKFKPTLKAYINQWSPLDLESVKSTLDVMANSGSIPGVKLAPEFDGWLFNFITDDEFVHWLEKEKLAYVFETIHYTVQRCPTTENKEEHT